MYERFSISTEMPVLPQLILCPVASLLVKFSISTEMPVLPQRRYGHGMPLCSAFSISTEMPVLPQLPLRGYRVGTPMGFQSQPRCPFFLNFLTFTDALLII